MSVQYITVEEDRNGQRIDNFLMAQFTQLPKTLIYRWLRKGELRVNKKRAKQTYRVQAGDVIRIPPFHLEENEDKIIKVTQEHLEYLESLILLENDDYLVINKPSGIAVHGGSGVNSGLIERLRQARPRAKKLELAHRLDKETSGCLLIAKKYSILTHFHDALRDRKMQKKYHALVHGLWSKRIERIDLPLKRHLLPHGERVVRVDHNDGKPSLSTVKIIQKYQQNTLLEVSPYTGRTHQIRVHLLANGCPIVCDDKYGDKNKDLFIERMGFKRLFLHAAELSFTDPKSGNLITVTAPYDKACEHLLNRMK